MIYNFTILLHPLRCDWGEAADRLYAAGCDDSLFAVREGTPRVIFDRDATTLRAAIDTATADIKRAGFSVRCVTFAE